MSEFFSGITFPWQKVTPSDDASVRRSVLADGILSGCEISYIGSTLTMGAGLLIGCGRQFRHTAVQNFAVTGASSGYARLVITIDTTKASTKDTFDQIGTAIEYATALDGFTQLRQDDINEAGTVYQMQICVVSLGAGGISGIVSQLGNAEKYASKELLWENASINSEFATQTVALELDGFSGVDVVFRNSAEGTDHLYSTHTVYFNSKEYECITADGYGKTVSRKARKNENGVYFGNGFLYASYGSFARNNLSMIPFQIYGIKGVSA